MKMTFTVTISGSENLKLHFVTDGWSNYWWSKEWMAVIILKTHYPSGQTWADICSSSSYASQGAITQGHKTMKMTFTVTISGSENLKLHFVTDGWSNYWWSKEWMAVIILKTHYPSGQTWADICSSSSYASQVISVDLAKAKSESLVKIYSLLNKI